MRARSAPTTFLGDALDAHGRQHLEPSELTAFFEAASPHPFWGPYFAIQYYYGARLSEVALIFEADIVLDRRRLLLKRLKKRAGRPSWVEENFPEGVMPTTYTIPAKLVDAIKRVRAWKARQGGRVAQSPFLFPSRRVVPAGKKDRLAHLRIAAGPGGLYSAVSRSAGHRAFVTFAEEAEIPPALAHSHVLRHTRATLLYAADASAAEVQHLLGHSDEKTTARYIGAAKALKDRFDEKLLERGLEGF